MFCSIVIPTYNRRPILEKCLQALEQQTYSGSYEVVVVDDGSTDDTIPWLRQQTVPYPHVRLLQQHHQGPAAARNLGVEQAAGDMIIFIDSDLVVTDCFLEAHTEAFTQAERNLGHNRFFTYGAVINTSNFESPTAEVYKLTDFSAAYFATGNVMISRQWLIQAGLFDPQFSLYGWEDLELGVRLKALRLKLIKVPQAVGYHWHPAFTLDQLPKLIDQELQRGKMGAVFYKKHPTWAVKMMIQMTALHWCLWGGLSLGGLLNEKSLHSVMQWLIQQGKPNTAYQVARVFLNWYSLQGLKQAMQLQSTQTSSS